jgi:XRN 5'-3' exonuclease N-terminus
MTLTEQALLYWAWQRLQNPRLLPAHVKIYISPSTVPGEGEVKLLEWILRQPHALKKTAGESIAILGGDSDLVLEGLVIPPSISHNVFVLLPDGSTQYLVVSLWETTRALAQFLGHTGTCTGAAFPSSWLPRLRTDLCLLLILNGNDYFPKLRGSSGFSKVFHAYLRTLQEWIKDSHHPPAFLVDPEPLEYNTPFCLAFFRRLEKVSPPAVLWQRPDTATNRDGRDTPLARFHGLVDSGFFPKPIRWRVGEGELTIDAKQPLVGEQASHRINPGDDNDNEESDEDGEDGDFEDNDDEDEDDDDDDDEDMYMEDGDYEEEEGMGDGDERQPQEKRLTTLRIGKPRTPDFVSYELWQPVTTTAKKAKQKLASMALEDLFGDLDNYYENVDNRDGLNASYPWEVGTVLPTYDATMCSHVPTLTGAIVACLGVPD